MSKLIERLEKVDAAATPPMGFGASRAQAKPASMLLIAYSFTENDVPPPGLRADGWLVYSSDDTEADLDAVKASAGDVPWGLQPDNIAPGSIDALKEKGADFIVIRDGFPVWALAEEELGRVLWVGSSVSETLARSLEELPVDAIIMDCGDSFNLYVQDLVNIRSVRECTSKPLLVQVVDISLGKAEVGLLQDAGVQGIVLGFGQMEESEVLQVREAIDALPPRKTKRDQPAPTLPGVASRETGHRHEEEPDDRLA